MNIEFRKEDIVVFEVLESETPRPWQGNWGGAVRPLLAWSTEQVMDSMTRMTRIALGCFEVPGWGRAHHGDVPAFSRRCSQTDSTLTM